MTGDLHLEMTCPHCAADLELVVEGTLRGTEHTSMWRCTGCRVEWSLRADLVPLVAARGENETARCGTDPGYRRDRRLGEEACAACLRAHADNQAAFERRRRQRVGVGT